MTAPLLFENLSLGDGLGVLHLEVPAHRTVSLVGDDASGVSRLGAIALGLQAVPAGRALVYGENLAEMSRRAALAFRRRVGYLPAGDRLLQNLSLYDNVALPLKFGSTLGNREIEGRTRVILAAVRLSEVGRFRPAQVSEERRRRAALARALAFDPELIILEHPFHGLTPRTAVELLDLARGGEIAEGSRRTVFVTGQHIPAGVDRRIDVGYHLVKGKLIRDD